MYFRQWTRYTRESNCFVSFECCNEIYCNCFFLSLSESFSGVGNCFSFLICFFLLFFRQFIRDIFHKVNLKCFFYFFFGHMKCEQTCDWLARVSVMLVSKSKDIGEEKEKDTKQILNLVRLLG